MASTQSARTMSILAGLVPLGASAGGHRGVFSEAASSKPLKSRPAAQKSLVAAIWAVFEREYRRRSEAGGLASGSRSASGAMAVENDPDLGHASLSRYVLSPPARRKTRSEKPESAVFGQRRRAPSASTATAAYPGSRSRPIPSVGSPRRARGDPMGPYGGREQMHATGGGAQKWQVHKVPAPCPSWLGSFLWVLPLVDIGGFSPRRPRLSP